MKNTLPLLVFLAACKPPPPDLSGIQSELAALRQQLDTVKAVNQPRLDAVEAMDDLAKEVKQLKQKLAHPAPVPAIPPPPTVLAPLKSGDLHGFGDGERCWVLSRIQVNGEERIVLCLYRAAPGDSGFKFDGARALNWDTQILQYNSNRPGVTEIMKEVERGKK